MKASCREEAADTTSVFDEPSSPPHPLMVSVAAISGRTNAPGARRRAPSAAGGRSMPNVYRTGPGARQVGHAGSGTVGRQVSPEPVDIQELLSFAPPLGVLSVYVDLDPGDRGEAWRIELRNGLAEARDSA